MRKIITFPLIVLFVTNLLSFMILANFKFSLFSADKIKNIARESNIYEPISAQLRENLLSDKAQEIGEGPLLEIINEAVSTTFIQELAEAEIDKVFASIENPNTDLNLNEPITEFQARIDEVLNTRLGITTESAIQASNDAGLVFKRADYPIARALANIDQVLLSLGTTLLILLLAIFFIASPTSGGRFVWLGWSFLLGGIAMSVVTYGICYLPLALQDQIIGQLNLSDQKLVIAATRVFVNIADIEKVFFIPESIALLLLGFLTVLTGRGRSNKKDS